jgi:thiamine-phosphate pyrophosphorylase
MHPDVAQLLRVMFVVDDPAAQGQDLGALCQAAERGGVTSILVRLARATPRELAAVVRSVRSAVRLPVLVSDRADVAISGGAAGVQLEPDGVPLQLVRRIAPQGFIIGATVGSITEVEHGRGADYWCVGPLRVPDVGVHTGAALGIKGFAGLVRRGEGRPCIAIGGIECSDVPAVRGASGAGVVVAPAILTPSDVEAASRAYCAAMRPAESLASQ